MVYVDATCPLVSKVHIEAQRHAECGLADDHDRSRGPPRNHRDDGATATGRVLLVETPADVDAVEVRDPAKLAYVHPKPRSASMTPRKSSRR